MSKPSSIKPTKDPINFEKNVGVSGSAYEVEKRTKELRNHQAGSVTFGEHIALMLEGLYQVKSECSTENWDGYGAKAIDNESFRNAYDFALLLPKNIPVPEIYVDPDGKVTFEWYEERRQVFSISIGHNNQLSYAGLYGYSKTSGVEYFYDDVPEIILNNINRLYSK